MADYAAILSLRYPGNQWSISGQDYDSLDWNGSNTIKKPTKKALDALVDEVDVEIKWNRIKERRNKLLSACDWTQLGDVGKSTQKKWKKYRQDLRDITDNFEDPDFVIFPQKPE